MTETPLPSQPHSEPHGRSLSPWMVIIGVALLAAVVVMGLGFLAIVTLPDRPLLPEGLARATLDDGSILILRDVTTDGNHSLKVPVPDDSWGRFGFVTHKMETIRAHHPHESLGLWFSRHDPQTGKSLPFDDWKRCIAQTADGYRVMDEDHAMRFAYGANHPGSSPHVSTTGSSRPFDPAPAGDYEHLLYSSSLPRLRPDGATFRLEVYNADDQRIATMDVPFPAGLSGLPIWSPDPLPATASNGDVEVTLERLEVANWKHRDARPYSLPRITVQPQLSIRQAGEVSKLWYSRNTQFEDALGNHAHLFDCPLSPQESAWKLSVKVFRISTAPFAPIQRLVVEDIPLPKRDQIERISKSLTYDGVEVTLLAVGGPGSVTHKFDSLLEHQSYSSSGGGGPDERYQIEVDYDGAASHAVVKSEQAHIVLRVLGDTPDHAVDVQVSDQNGITMESSHMHHQNEIRIAFLKADDLATHVNVYAVVQRGRTMELLVAPPEIPSDDGAIAAE